MSDPKEISVRVPDALVGGVYANEMIVRHTREEFLIDFVHLVPPAGVVNARVVVSPGHLKRIVAALGENLRHYEERFGPIREAQVPTPAKSSMTN